MKEINDGAPARLCIVTAVDIEFKTAAGLLRDCSFSNDAQMKVCRGRLGNRRITVLKSLMGAIGFAERLAHHLDANRYDALIVAGLGGALDPQLKTGDAVVFDHCYNGRNLAANSNFKEISSPREENESIACDIHISKYIFEKLQRAGLSCLYGAGVTVDQIIVKARDKAFLGMRFKAQAIDMETYQILTVCKVFGLPATALRVISDEASFDLPDFNRALNRDGSISRWRAAAVLIRNPLISLRFLLNMKPVIDALRANLIALLNA